METQENILKKKRKAINAIAYARAGLDKELLYEVVYSCTQKTSIRALTIKECNRVIATLLSSIDNNKKRKKRTSNDQIIYLATPDQKKHIQSLSKKLRWSQNQIDSFCYRQYKKPLSNLTLAQAQGIIEALKSITNRAKNQ